MKGEKKKMIHTHLLPPKPTYVLVGNIDSITVIFKSATEVVGNVEYKPISIKRPNPNLCTPVLNVFLTTTGSPRPHDLILGN